MEHDARSGAAAAAVRQRVLDRPRLGPDGDIVSATMSQCAALVTATASVATLLDQRRMPVGKNRALQLLDAAAANGKKCNYKNVDKRIGVYAASWASHYLRHVTGTVTVIRPSTLRLKADVAALQLPLLAVMPGTTNGVHVLDVRLAHHLGAQFTFDQITHAHQAKAVGADRFARAALVAHFAIGDTMDGFNGVRLIAPRAPLGSRHYTDVTTSHPMNACISLGHTS